ncbi:hypothetical protein ON010_g17451 [Phytophthora cinnamomi]|nr:hypothetical protein ON010_g17451 [Phytophthora cinnamomi]
MIDKSHEPAKKLGVDGDADGVFGHLWALPHDQAEAFIAWAVRMQDAHMLELAQISSLSDLARLGQTCRRDGCRGRRCASGVDWCLYQAGGSVARRAQGGVDQASRDALRGPDLPLLLAGLPVDGAVAYSVAGLRLESEAKIMRSDNILSNSNAPPEHVSVVVDHLKHGHRLRALHPPVCGNSVWLVRWSTCAAWHVEQSRGKRVSRRRRAPRHFLDDIVPANPRRGAVVEWWGPSSAVQHAAKWPALRSPLSRALPGRKSKFLPRSTDSTDHAHTVLQTRNVSCLSPPASVAGGNRRTPALTFPEACSSRVKPAESGSFRPVAVLLLRSV